MFIAAPQSKRGNAGQTNLAWISFRQLAYSSHNIATAIVSGNQQVISKLFVLFHALLFRVERFLFLMLNSAYTWQVAARSKLLGLVR